MKHQKFIYIFFLIFYFFSFKILKTEETKSQQEPKININKFPKVEIVFSLEEGEELPIDIDKQEFRVIEFVDLNNKKEITPENISILETDKKESKKKKGAMYSLLLDSTKSLSKQDFEFLKKNIENFIKNKKENDLISIYSLNGGAKKIQSFTTNKKKLLNNLEDISLKGKETKLYDAIYSVLLDMNKFSKKRKEEIGGIFIFTDGKEETSFLAPKDIEDLIMFGTKFEIPIYFILAGNKKNIQIFEKIALKTGGKVFLENFDPSLILHEESNHDFLIIKSLNIQYKSKLNIGDTFLNPLITTEIFYKERKIFQTIYSVSLYNTYWIIGISLVLIFLAGVLGWYLWYKNKKNQNLIQISKEKKIEFPEPEIGEIFADLRKYSDKPEKKYIESEEKPDIPLIAKNWIDPQEIYDLDDPYIKKKLTKDALNLSLKEKSYIVLQTALKEAPKYNHGILVKKDREGLGYDKKFDLFLEEVYIGSSTSAHIPVRDSAVSGIHAKIKKIDNKFILFDLMSMTGTYLNGKKVLRPMPLRHNDEIRMGHTIFRFIGEKE